MWAFLSTRLRTWLLVAFAIPVVRLLLRRIAGAATRRNPASTTARLHNRTDTALANVRRRKRSRR